MQRHLWKDLELLNCYKGTQCGIPCRSLIRCIMKTNKEDEDDDKQLLKPEERESLTSSLIDEIHGEGLGGVAADIFNIGLVNNDVKDKVQRLQKQLKLKQIPSSTIPFFSEAEPTNKESSKFSPFVKVQRNDQFFYIRKTTAVWLFQESEHVSSDRLLRVRCKQPYAFESSLCTLKAASVSTKPVTLDSVQLGDLCVWKVSDQAWRLGRVLQFAKYSGKRMECTQQYEGYTADVAAKNVGVLCSWYNPVPGSQTRFQLSHSSCSKYVSLSCYLGSLTENCLEDENESNCSGSVLPLRSKLRRSITKRQFSIKEECIACIKLLFSDHNLEDASQNIIHEQAQCNSLSLSETTGPTSEVIVVTDEDNDDVPVPPWVKIGEVSLYNFDKEDLLEGKWLSDAHVNAVQLLLKVQFPRINGLECTLKATCKPLSLGSLQILHVNGDHWITVTTCDCDGVDIIVFDSKYVCLTKSTMTLLTKLIKSKNNIFTAQITNTIKQSGSSDCGVFAAAYATSLAFGHDPCAFVYDQCRMREHLLR